MKIDEYKKPEDQIDEILHKIKPIIPIKFDKKQIEVKIFREFAPKVYGDMKQYRVMRESWNTDGSLTMVIEVPAGLKVEFIDKVNSLTHGNVEVRVLNE